jgi:hypothetical protein
MRDTHGKANSALPELMWLLVDLTLTLKLHQLKTILRYSWSPTANSILGFDRSVSLAPMYHLAKMRYSAAFTTLYRAQNIQNHMDANHEQDA